MNASRARSFVLVFAASLVAFLFVAAGALSTYRLLGMALAFPFGLLVGVAERSSLARAGRAPPHRFALRSAIAFLVWALASGAALRLLVPRVAALDEWSGLLLLAASSALPGAVLSAAVEARAPNRARSFATFALARIAAPMVAVAVYRTGHLYPSVVAGAAAYALAFTAGLS